MKRTHRIVTVLAVLITFTTIIADCGGSSPTEPKPLAATPTPTPAPGTPTPTPTPKLGTTPTSTPVPTISISVVTLSFKPPAGSDVVIGQGVYFTFRITGVTSGTVGVDFSEDGVSRSSKSKGDSAPVSGSLITCGISMQSVGKTKAILFDYSAAGGVGIQIPGSTYMVTYNWVNPTTVVSIGPGGVFTPRDSGVLPVGIVVTYRNDDNSNHQPHSSNSGMVDCHYLLPTETCSFVTYSVGVVFKVSVADSWATDPYAEVHTFTVSP